MHEVSIAQGMMKIIDDETAKHKMSRVSNVRVRIGTLSACVPEALRFAFDVVSKDTIAEGADLDIEVVPAKGRCDTCGIEFDIDEVIFLCPQCQGIASDVIAGKELEIAEIEGD